MVTSLQLLIRLLGQLYAARKFEICKIVFQNAQHTNIHPVKFLANIPRNERAVAGLVLLGANADLYPGTGYIITQNAPAVKWLILF